jgi:hypothetical protein
MTVSRLPQSNTRAIWTIALFIAVQCADAAQTAHGIQRFGLGIEANPILAFYLATAGPTTTLVGAKLIAVAGGAALYLCARYVALVVLTITVVFSAVLPWAFVLGR